MRHLMSVLREVLASIQEWCSGYSLKRYKLIEMDKLDYTVLDLEAWEQIDDLLYQKQLIYVGKFVKDDGNGSRQEFEVTPQHLYHWASQGNLMLGRGIAIPMPKGHTNDPEARRAEITSFSVKEDEKARLSLYGICRFKNKETLEALKASNVSIETIKEFVDGKDRKYKWPIMHVAFTDYPVIPDLGPFQAIAASLLDLGPEDEQMNEELAALCEEFGIPTEETWTDTEAADAIRAYVAQLQAEEDNTDEFIDEEPVEELSAGFNVPPAMLRLARSSRETVIDSLVTNGNILPAVARDLKSQYCSSEAISLSMAGAEDGFERVVDTLKKNQAVKLGEQTGHQSLFALSHGRDNGKSENPLVRRAREKRERFESR